MVDTGGLAAARASKTVHTPYLIVLVPGYRCGAAPVQAPIAQTRERMGREFPLQIRLITGTPAKGKVDVAQKGGRGGLWRRGGASSGLSIFAHLGKITHWVTAGRGISPGRPRCGYPI